MALHRSARPLAFAMCALVCVSSRVEAQRARDLGAPAPEDADAAPTSAASAPRDIAPSPTTPRAAATTVPEAYRVPPPPAAAGAYPAMNGVTPGGRRPPSASAMTATDRTRIRVLGSNLDAIAASTSSSVTEGVLAMSSGALSLAIGGLYDDADISRYLYLYGGAGLARGLVLVALATDPGEVAVDFAHLPNDTRAEIDERIAFGENALESLADRARLIRVLDASINLGVGAAVLPIFLAPNDWKVEEPFDYIVVIGSAVSVVTGLIGLFTRTDTEKRWESYERLRDRLARRRPAADLELGMGSLGVRVSF